MYHDSARRAPITESVMCGHYGFLDAIKHVMLAACEAGQPFNSICFRAIYAFLHGTKRADMG